ncbi:hypothetical protein QBC41DRAFT_333821 [Cercophora samala]|uniref:Uncharacterized protein n=1 Tax=Cercophora samala TaxID=330535 RepID=A0AA39ZLB4_9PEZI|nr:hypothetical protein QBC41DRAFT_333821 [Cercophora samala]
MANQLEIEVKDQDACIHFGEVWAKMITASVVGDSNTWCQASLIAIHEGGKWNHKIWHRLEDASEALSDEPLLQDIIDQAGKFPPRWWRDDSDEKGTGVWIEGKIGDYLLVFEIAYVSPILRQEKVGRKLVEAVLERAFERMTPNSTLTALVKPGIQLKAEDDCDGPDGALGIPFHDMNSVLKKVGNPQQDDESCRRLLTARLFSDVNHDDWSSTTADKGYTLVHLAATSCKPRTLEFLLSKKSDLLLVQDNEGNTPLEAFQKHIDESRTTSTGPPQSIVDEILGLLEPSRWTN